MFKGGSTYVKDKPRPGRPMSATSENDIRTVKIIFDARYTVKEIVDYWSLVCHVCYLISKKN